VAVDKFTKYGPFLPLKHPFTVATVARLFLDHIYKLHGLPLSIVSDRDQNFTSKFWSELFSMAKVQLRMSFAYHPQLDGQTERVNQCLKTFLRCFVSACPKQWYGRSPCVSKKPLMQVIILPLVVHHLRRCMGGLLALLAWLVL
jgi:transposase InsO family protein